MYNDIVYAAMGILLVISIWEIAWYLQKKLVPIQIGDPTAPCICGSANTQVEGRRTHYTSEEFDARLMKKYDRKGTRLKTYNNALDRIEREIRLPDADVERLRSQAASLTAKREAELTRLVKKYQGKWVQCCRCGATSRLHYHSPEVVEQIDLVSRWDELRPHAMSEASAAWQRKWSE